MNYSDYRFPLDVQTHQAQVSVPVTLGDTARKLCISLTDGRKPYVIAEGCIATFNARKPDGNIIKNSCIIERNTIIYEFTEQTTNVEGVVNCDVTIYGVDGKVLYSPQFILVVDKKVVRDEAIPLSESEITAFDGILVAEAARKVAELTRESNETTRQQNEETRQQNEETRQKNEGERQSEFEVFILDAQSAFNQAEQERMEIFGEAEAERKTTFETAEELRKEAENARLEAEEARIANELERQTEEDRRYDAELEREEAEANRKMDELYRVANENARLEAEERRNALVGDLDAALDELHAYAQALIGGGNA